MKLKCKEGLDYIIADGKKHSREYWQRLSARLMPKDLKKAGFVASIVIIESWAADGEPYYRMHFCK